jgi:hypothetical protein
MRIRHIKFEEFRRLMKIAIIVLIFSLLYWSYCNKFQQAKRIDENLEQFSEFDETDVAEQEQKSGGRQGVAGRFHGGINHNRNRRPELKARELPVVEIMMQDLKEAIGRYESSAFLPIPNCGQCSDLELLLILEKAIRTPKSGINVPNITKNRTLSPEYLGGFGEMTYQLGKATVGYEMWFNRPPPTWDFSDEEQLKRLKNAIDIGSPYLTESEEALLKAEYLRKFRRPMADFEFSLTKINFEQRLTVSALPSHFSITRTATGALAKYLPPPTPPSRHSTLSRQLGDSLRVELELNTDEWLDFVNALYEQNVADLREYYNPSSGGEYAVVTLSFMNRDEMNFAFMGARPQSWDSILKLMNDMEDKTKRDGYVRHLNFIECRNISGQITKNGIQNIVPLRKKSNPLNGTISVGNTSIIGLKNDGTMMIAAPRHLLRREILDTVALWDNITAISLFGFSGTDIIGLKSDGTVVVHSIPRYHAVNWNNIIEISTNHYSVIGLMSNGRVVALDNIYSNLQLNVGDWNDIIAISAGRFHTLGLRSDGTVVATGAGCSGQCNVANWNNIIAISAGRFHSVGLKSNGRVVATGRDFNGMVSQVSNWRNIVAIAVGDFHTVGLRSDGTIVAVGDNEYGQCNVSDWSNIIAITASDNHTVGLKSDGTAMVAGMTEGGKSLAEQVSSWIGLRVE